jgi:hypothetical protein
MLATMLPYEETLRSIVRSDSAVMEILRAVRSVDPPDWLVGAGMLRNVVWDALHGYEEPTAFRDVDVAYFDPTDLGREREQEIELSLHRVLPGVPWQVKNQAAVHLWYKDRFGYAVEPLVSIEDAVGTWPETVTAVGIRLFPDDELEVLAPHGLDDMFELVLRRNPRRVSLKEFHKRMQDKRVLERWPRVRLVDG